MLTGRRLEIYYGVRLWRLEIGAVPYWRDWLRPSSWPHEFYGNNLAIGPLRLIWHKKGK